PGISEAGLPTWERGFMEGFSAGSTEVLRWVRKSNPQLKELLEELRVNLDQLDAMDRERQQAQDLKRARNSTKDPAVKAARTKQFKRALRDQGQALEFS